MLTNASTTLAVTWHWASVPVLRVDEISLRAQNFELPVASPPPPAANGQLTVQADLTLIWDIDVELAEPLLARPQQIKSPDATVSVWVVSSFSPVEEPAIEML
jgi:hypothetical protein